jgi:transposase InsO family protein
MAWKETCVMDERMCFIASCIEGRESVSQLCLHFGISRKTGHKWLKRYAQDGASGLADRSRAPHSNPRAVDAALAARIIAVRLRHATWGPRKVKAYLEALQPDTVWPAASTIGGLFDRFGLTRPRRRRRRTPPHNGPFAACREANDVWCVDFKGWFLTGDGIQVDPLTISDGASRYLIRCQALGRADEEHVWPVFEEAFYEYGLPLAMRSDNGSPFASRAVAGLSRLAVKLIKAGVKPERIEPGKPQQNGRHERMHLTLKQETALPPARSLAEQIQRFAEFREIYNNVRPHEALGQRPPASVYVPSPRVFDGVLRSPDYPDDAVIRKVRTSGEIKWRGEMVFVSEVLRGEPVGLTEIGDDVWLVKYGPVILGTLSGRDAMRKIDPGRPAERQPYRQPGGTKLLPMSPG